ncbi:hypothetical protein [Streptomyces collinus]|uniref:hypothetical protein n=1 Tax=Streptomyces collinus TaxID=42684 RepID=UPI0029435F84|nr:hypothetical protein [Streptomyces collinus]
MRERAAPGAECCVPQRLRSGEEGDPTSALTGSAKDLAGAFDADDLLSRAHPDRLAATATEALRLRPTDRIDITAAYELADTDTALQRLAAGGSRGTAIVRIG